MLMLSALLWCADTCSGLYLVPLAIAVDYKTLAPCMHAALLAICGQPWPCRYVASDRLLVGMLFASILADKGPAFHLHGHLCGLLAHDLS